MCGVTLAIVMELCRLGSFYKLIEQARRVAHLPLEVRTGARCPSTPEMAKTKVTPLSLVSFPTSPLGLFGHGQGNTAVQFLCQICPPWCCFLNVQKQRLKHAQTVVNSHCSCALCLSIPLFIHPSIHPAFVGVLHLHSSTQSFCAYVHAEQSLSSCA